MIVMTYRLAMAAAHDAAERQRRRRYGQHPIKRNLKWNVDDWNLMAHVFHEIYVAPNFPQLAEKESLCR